MTITNTLSSNFITAAPEHAAVAELAQRYGPQVYRVAHRLLGDTAQAEDVQQDGFLRLLESGPLAVAYWPAYLSTLVWFPIGSLNCFRAFRPEGVGVRRRHSPPAPARCRCGCGCCQGSGDTRKVNGSDMHQLRVRCSRLAGNF